ncbi:MAG: Spy/CpxP family protein refolding chaperone [candidate division NC10 bacterium]|nr:Spy/CpxP family protein refolding chaperone [candidate division NC10 bacterium]
MKRTFAVAGLLVMVLSLVATAQAWYPAGGRGMGPAPGWGTPFSSSDLAPGLKPTPEQLSQWSDLRSKWLAEVLPLRNQLLSKRMELAALLARPDADAQAIKNKHREVIALAGQLKEKEMDHRLAFRQTLTPEQLSLWIAHKSARPWCSGEMGRDRGRGPRHGMGPGRGMGPGCCYR